LAYAVVSAVIFEFWDSAMLLSLLILLVVTRLHKVTLQDAVPGLEIQSPGVYVGSCVHP
jgi:hypothetical protein